MNVRFLLDVHVPKAVALGLRLRGVDVLTAQEDGSGQLEDRDLLLRALALGRILVTQDEDLLREGTDFLTGCHPFAGIIYAHQMGISIGRFVSDLEMIAAAMTADEWQGRIEFLPLD